MAIGNDDIATWGRRKHNVTINYAKRNHDHHANEPNGLPRTAQDQPTAGIQSKIAEAASKKLCRHIIRCYFA